MESRFLAPGEAIGDPSRDVVALHITDFHLQKGRLAPVKFSHLTDSLRAANHNPDALIFGGDFVMNSVSVDLERANEQWDVWDVSASALPDAPRIGVLGNQDIWGWNRKKSGCTGEEPLFGKKLAQTRLGFERTTAAYHLGAWKVLVLDTIEEGGRYGFIPRVGAEGMEFVRRESLSHDGPVFVVTHVPLVPTTADFLSLGVLRPEKSGEWVVPGHQFCVDGFESVEAWKDLANLRFFLSGHSHIAQETRILDMRFIASPAVCGAWWRGNIGGAHPGYTVLNLKATGDFEVDFRSVSYAHFPEA